MSSRTGNRIAAACVVAALSLVFNAVVRADDLENGFAKPPDTARPWVYWFWLNGNITREGITADLEAMKRVGIGGVLIMEVDQGIPKGPIPFMSAQWRDLFKFVVTEAQRLGLEVNMNDDAGWNGSGGPWIKPEQSMQKVVFTETNVEGPQHFDAKLPQAQAVAGFYRDIAVQAFPATGAYRIENLPNKAGYAVGFGGWASPKDLLAEMVIDRGKMIDLTPKMDKDGHLVWDAPAGKWTVVRFGHTSTGMENAPAPESGRGLECDKLSKEGIEANFAGMMGPLIADVGAAAGKTLVTTHIDSWENGAQNWTARMREEFQKRRGYDMTPFLPAFTGRVVGSLEISERFLWDLRMTIAEMVADNYAGRMQELARQHGMKLSIEAYGGPTDDIAYGGRADEPMCEFWIGGAGFPTPKEMASAAHTYGKPILGAEAFTADDREKWQQHPASIKALGDRAFCDGVNRFVFHRYALQPWADRRPGMTMGPWGLHYERTETWWDMSPAWHQYLARCQYMLRQGLFVADICYLQPEFAPQGFRPHNRRGYDYDNCGAEVVLTRMTVKDGRIVLPDGMSYRILVLPDEAIMTPPLLRKIKELVQAGATVVGPRPTKSPSLTDYPKCDDEVKQIANEVWADCDGKSVKEHRFGQGRVLCGVTPEKALSSSGTRPDFANRGNLNFIHRSTANADIYFVANPEAASMETSCTFRVSGKAPELWWPDTGRTEPAGMYTENGGVTSVSFRLDPGGSVFVVFRNAAAPGTGSVTAVARDGKPLLSVDDPAPKVVVTKATYGILTDAQLTRDVKDEVQKRIDSGDTALRVSLLAETKDPAPNKEKRAVIEYTVGDQHCTVTGADPDTVYLNNVLPKITVDKATYGVPSDASRTRDVKSKLQQIVDAGESSFEVPRMAQGDDPAVNVVKTLVVEYTTDGKHLTATGTDMDTVHLLPVPKGAEQIANVYIGADGKLLLEAWQPGRYDVKLASGQTQTVDAALPKTQVDVAGPWEVRFSPNSGAPEKVTLDKLISWSEHSDPGVKYFSGTATYTKTINAPNELLGAGRRLYLDLGKVQVMAQVKLNGKDLGVLWKPPYRVDITAAAKPGDNTLEVSVVNLWVNRLIGDEQLPEDSARNPEGTLKEWPQWVNEGKPSPTGRIAFTTWRLWKKDSPLQESGLIGPVTLQSAQILQVTQ
ncbi:MAG: hypothetical protein HZB26_04875 [Candidatus Hydrogenedentes bacterium]|nr:hypothetical protein [Candidatus Hydrogenedentota bacterium]